MAKTPETIKQEFLSTPSARRATYMDIYYFNVPCNFYPRPPRGGRHKIDQLNDAELDEFLSTPSARRATSDGNA